MLIEDEQLSWVDLNVRSSHTFVSATYCSSVERVCATTETGDLVFFKIHEQAAASNCNRSRQLSERGGNKSPLKLLIHEPLNWPSLQLLHQLTLAEKLPLSCNPSVSAASCWMEVAVTQRQRRQPQPWLIQQGTTFNNVSEDGLQMARIFKLQQDKFSWDEHFFEIALPQTVAVAHVHLRFVLAPSYTVPPEIQVSFCVPSAFRSIAIHPFSLEFSIFVYNDSIF